MLQAMSELAPVEQPTDHTAPEHAGGAGGPRPLTRIHELAGGQASYSQISAVGVGVLGFAFCPPYPHQTFPHQSQQSHQSYLPLGAPISDTNRLPNPPTTPTNYTASPPPAAPAYDQYDQYEPQPPPPPGPEYSTDTVQYSTDQYDQYEPQPPPPPLESERSQSPPYAPAALPSPPSPPPPLASAPPRETGAGGGGNGGEAVAGVGEAPQDPQDPGRAAWHAARKRGLGGSDVAGVLGVSPWYVTECDQSCPGM
eukprot:9485601-Pyramimonas_sp.AAC.2